MTWLPGDGKYSRVSFTYERRVDGEWQFAKRIELPLCVADNIIFCGDGLVPGYQFEQDQVDGLTDDKFLDSLAAEQAFVLSNEANMETATIGDDQDWMQDKRVTWRLYAQAENCHTNHDHAVRG